MATTSVSETLLSLSASVKLLLDKIVSNEFVGNFLCTMLELSLLTKIETTLLRVLNVLPFVVGADVNEWSDTLRYVVFEVDTLFDEINTEALHCKLEAQYQIPFKPINRVSNSQMQKLIERLQFLVDESCIYGRDNDIKKLKHLLLSTDCDNSQIRVISIVGMGGIGKTTLAKLLYNDPRVKDKFELKLWEDISKYVDNFRVLETNLESIISHAIISGNLNNKRNGVNTVYPKLLLVLDDFLDARSVNWTLLMDILNAEKTGSRIIITTRDERVPIYMQTFFYVHYLRPLESEDCWSIVARHAMRPLKSEDCGYIVARRAFEECNYQQRSTLEEIGREIAKKCDGLPLAAVSLGNLLHNKFFPDKWNDVLESSNWKSLGYEVQATIESSYHYLLDPLKRCFAYCSIFPKKSILEKAMVVQLWIAEGLVESSTGQASLEKVGEEYFDLLVSRSLIQQRFVDGEQENFEMHNIVHDLATMVSFPYCMGLDEHHLLEVHYFSYIRGLYDSFNKFNKLEGFKGMRTFLALPLQEQPPLCLLSNKVVHDLLPTMKQLRTLSLSNYKSITEVPNSIGNLLYLRYLNLSHTKIERLPSETCKLYNLQFLLLAGCRRLIELPEDMGNSVNLRHLDVSDTALRDMPIQIAKLENLHTLSDLLVSKHNDGLKLAQLGKFPHLHGKLSISQLQNANDPFEADQTNMKMKERIEELVLEWDCGSAFRDSQIQTDVLENLQPSTNLKSLTIKGYGGIHFPNWLGDSLFSNMVYLRISNCDDCLWLPPLG